MEKVDIRFTGFDEPDIYDKYIEYKQMIQKDFRKISKELISKYKNSENLVSEMLFTAENVTYCRTYEDDNEEEFIRFTDKYLSFSYPIFDQYYDIHYLNIVIVKNYKEFYFINFNVDDTNVFLIMLKSGGTGLNLTSASVVIHLDLWWNPQAENQDQV